MTHRFNLRRRAQVLFVAGICLCPRGWAENPHTTVFPPNARPFSLALSNADWAARWWTWALTIPNSTNPTLDVTGANCNVGQTSPVFFLAGAPVTTAITRECTVPTNTPLFFPLVTSECSTVEPPPFWGANEAQLRACTKALIDGVDLSTLKLTIDGTPVTNLASYRVQTGPFAYTVPTDNQLAVPGGTTPVSVADGFFVMLQLQGGGKHTIHFEAAITSGPGGPFFQNVTYTLHAQGN